MNAARPILLATDGSPSAAQAERKAIELARALEAPLVVVSVAHLTLPMTGYGGYGYPDIVAELKNEEHKRVEKVLAYVTETAKAEGVSCSAVLTDGYAVDEICEKARECDAQLIVVGSHGWGAARRLFSGSVSTGLVHSAPCPVLVVRTAEQGQEHAAAA